MLYHVSVFNPAILYPDELVLNQASRREYNLTGVAHAYLQAPETSTPCLQARPKCLAERCQRNLSSAMGGGSCLDLATRAVDEPHRPERPLEAAWQALCPGHSAAKLTVEPGQVG